MNQQHITGPALVYGDDVDTDQIIPARYLVTTDPAELGGHCMADSARPIVEGEGRGAILVAGRNFGCGSSREHAPLALVGAGIQAVVAHSFARIFFRNAINVGLTVVECDLDGVADGDSIQIDVAGGTVESPKGSFPGAPLPPFVTEIVSAGGLVPWARAALEREQAAAGGAS